MAHFRYRTLILCSLFLFLTHVGAIETVYDAALIARKLVDQSVNSIATMGTVFPSDHPTLGGGVQIVYSQLSLDPSSGQSFVLQEYYASCLRNGSLTLLVLPISTHSKNILRSPDRSASLSVTSDSPAARNARVSLIGNVTIFEREQDIPDLQFIRRCYLERHPDAKSWLPEDDDAAHISYWGRFDPQNVYFVGGFGDEHYIGFIPLNLYQDAVPQYTVPNLRPLGVAGRIVVEQY